MSEAPKVCGTPIASDASSSGAASTEAVKEVEYMSPLVGEVTPSKAVDPDETTKCSDEDLTFPSPTLVVPSASSLV